MRGDELKAIGAWLKQRTRMKPTGKNFFVSEQRKPLHRSTVNLILDKCSKASALPLYLQHSNELSESGRDRPSLPVVLKTVSSAARRMRPLTLCLSRISPQSQRR